jgi:hypothetical protein
MKNKNIAVVLVIFFSFWSWLYTYRKNLVKFWITLSLNIIAVITIFITGIIFIGIITEGHPEYIEYLRGFETLFHSDSANISAASYRTFSIIILALVLISIFEIGIWIWAIVDNAMKPKAFYALYPNKSRNIYP